MRMSFCEIHLSASIGHLCVVISGSYGFFCSFALSDTEAGSFVLFDVELR